MSMHTKLIARTVVLTCLSTLLLVAGLAAVNHDPIAVAPDGTVTIGNLRVGGKSLDDYIKSVVSDDHIRQLAAQYKVSDDHIRQLASAYRVSDADIQRLAAAKVSDAHIISLINSRCYYFFGYSDEAVRLPEVATLESMSDYSLASLGNVERPTYTELYFDTAMKSWGAGFDQWSNKGYKSYVHQNTGLLGKIANDKATALRLVSKEVAGDRLFFDFFCK